MRYGQGQPPVTPGQPMQVKWHAHVLNLQLNVQSSQQEVNQNTPFLHAIAHPNIHVESLPPK